MKWARETAGLSLAAAAHALDLNAKKGTEQLAAIEDGREQPSRAVLLRMAREYRRPLLTFYLAEPPRVDDRGKDFRTIHGLEPYDATVNALVRDIKARQGLMRSMLEDEGAPPVSFVGSAKPGIPAQMLAREITERIGFSLTVFRATKDVEAAFAYLRECIEGIGVFVILLGNLGSYHTNIPVEVFRGFAIADPTAPLIVINDQDAHVAWAFTALHELAHLVLGATGISGMESTNKLEQYCNEVAAEILLPLDESHQLEWRTNELPQIVDAISAFADARRISRTMVAYRLLRAGRINHDFWKTIRDHFTKKWAEQKEHETEKGKGSEGKPNFYVIRRHRIGHALLSLVRRSLDEGTTTYTKASRVLGVKPRSVEPLLSVGRGVR